MSSVVEHTHADSVVNAEACVYIPQIEMFELVESPAAIAQRRALKLTGVTQTDIENCAGRVFVHESHCALPLNEAPFSENVTAPLFVKLSVPTISLAFDVSGHRCNKP
jgi:hypothetical protein